MAPHVLPRHWIVALCGAVVLGSLGVLPVSHIAAATTYTVNVTTDTGAGAGTTGDLRYAVNQVNAGSGGDTINITATGTIMLTQGTLTLAKNVTITGPGAASLAIDGGCTTCSSLAGAHTDGVTVFTVSQGITASISGLTIQHGKATNACGFNTFCGGGIATSGTFTVTDCTITANFADTEGGGIFSSLSTLTVTNSTINGNYTFGNGAGIESEAILIVSGSTLSGNITSTTGRYGRGGGIEAFGTVTVRGSTIANNQANIGGGIENYGTLTVMDSTISGNHAIQEPGIDGGSGGGIMNWFGESLNVSDSTVSGNSADDGFSGGIRNKGTIVLTTSTVSDNTGGLANQNSCCGGTPTATVSNSTFTRNTSGGGAFQGGAITNSGATMAITNSTLSANAANGGGGILNTAGATLTVTNSTIANNIATQGGGVLNTPQCSYPDTCAIPVVNLTNTLLASNTGGDLTDRDYQVHYPYGFVGYFNLIDDAANAGGFTDNDAYHSIVGHPAGLGTLGDNGGPTQTIPLLYNSPAINTGAPVGQGPGDNLVPATDQRGIARPQGAGVDIGAYEFIPPNTLPTSQPPGAPTAGASPLPSPRAGGSSAPGSPAPLPPSRPGGVGNSAGGQAGSGAPASAPVPRP